MWMKSIKNVWEKSYQLWLFVILQDHISMNMKKYIILEKN